jgi:hypothetical protein
MQSEDMERKERQELNNSQLMEGSEAENRKRKESARLKGLQSPSKRL